MGTTQKYIVDYETLEGRSPFREWLTRLDLSISVRVEARINRIAMGNFGDAKPVGSGVSELRLTFGSGYRIYFGVHKQKIVVLLCGGDKASQAQDIKIAKKYWEDFKRRNYGKA